MAGETHGRVPVYTAPNTSRHAVKSTVKSETQSTWSRQAAVATMVLLVQGTVKDITEGTAAGAMDTHVPMYFHSNWNCHRHAHPMPRPKGRHNS